MGQSDQDRRHQADPVIEPKSRPVPARGTGMRLAGRTDPCRDMGRTVPLPGRTRMQKNWLVAGALAAVVLFPTASAKAQLVLNANAWVPPSHHMVSEIMMG